MRCKFCFKKWGRHSTSCLLYNHFTAEEEARLTEEQEKLRNQLVQERRIREEQKTKTSEER